MSNDQVTVTQSEPPTDSEILTWKVKKLKEYTKTHSTIKSTSSITDKHRLQFVAMDCTEWNFDRIDNLYPKCRGFLIEKQEIKSSKLQQSQIQIYLNPSDNQMEQRNEIINQMLKLLQPELNKSNEIENKINEINENDIGNVNENQERAVELHNDNDNDNDSDDMSSVSTHASMPSLMSDDESDEDNSDDNESDESDSDNDQLLGFENEEKSNTKAIKLSQNNKKGKKNNNKQDDFFNNKKNGGFFNKGKKKQTKKKNVTKQNKKNKSQPQTAKNNKNTKNTKKNTEIKPEIEIPKEAPTKPKPKPKPKAKPKKEEIIAIAPTNTNIGYNLYPLLIDASKDSHGDVFICIGVRKESSDLTQYKYCKCWISLKNKLKKKGKKKPIHFAVLISMINEPDLKREIERSTLKMGFENVLSFKLNNKYYIKNIFENNNENHKFEQFDHAFEQYKDEFGININNKWYTKEDKDEIIEIKEEIIEIIAEDSYSYINVSLMNECRLNKNDISSLLNDPTMDNTIEDIKFFVRVLKGSKDSKEYRIGQINKCNYYNKEYKFIGDIKTNKGFNISFGKSKSNKKFIKISNDDIIEKELSEWINKMKKDNIQLPKHKELDKIASTLDIIRSTMKLKAKQLQNNIKQQINKPIINNINNINQPGSKQPIQSPDYQNDDNNIDNIVPLSAQALAQLNQGASEINNKQNYGNYLGQYFDAIAAGYHSFWCIPMPNKTDEDSQYIAFLLGKSSKNKPLLKESTQIALNINKKIRFAEIREWTYKNKESVHSNDYYKATGLIFDCCNYKDAGKLYKTFDSDLLPRAPIGKGYDTNFVRHVLPAFGKTFLDIQLSNDCPQLTPKIKGKPQGPKYAYNLRINGKQGEPSIATMSEAPQIIKRGELDHTMCGDDDVRSLGGVSDNSGHSHHTNISQMSHKTDVKYDQFAHMKRPQYNNPYAGHNINIGRNVRFVVGNKVKFAGNIYEVIQVKGDQILIENDQHSATVLSRNVKKIME